MPAAATSGVAVVIPCRDEAAYIESVLDSIAAQDLPPDEVIVVDGGSKDGTLDAIRQYVARHPESRIRVIAARGASIAAALNAGVAATSCELIVRMDAHARPASDYIRLAVHALRETGAAVVGGVWKISRGRAGAVAEAIARAVAHPMGAGDAAYRLGLTRRRERQAVDTVPYGCFHRSHWQRIGGYDEELLVNEDYEFNYRTRQTGGNVVLDTAIQCEYFARPTLSALARQYFRYGWWKGRMLRQHPGSIRLRQLAPALFLPSWLLLIVAATAMPAARPIAAALAAAYVGMILVAGVHASAGQWRIALPAAAAFATIHAAWSAGFASFFLTGASLIGRRQPGGRRPRAGLTGAQLLGALAVILALSVIAPWIMATSVNRARVARAERDVRTIADALRSDKPMNRGAYERDVVLVGAGAEPRIPSDGDWRDVVAVDASAVRVDVPVGSDPWGNHYLIWPWREAGETGTPMARWALSARPNGIVETRYDQPAASAVVGGDDVGVRLN